LQSKFRLRVLGGFALEGPSGTVQPPRPQRRGDAVLAVLAVCGDLGCTRERLGALLWPESDEARSQQGLRDALYAIRRALDANVVTPAARLLRLDPAVVTSDVVEFTQAVGSGRHADAVRVYRGPLLDGFHVEDALEFERWMDGERTRLARHYAEALEHLATEAERTGAWHDAVGWWARAVEHDPVNSHIVLRHARAMAAIGDRANALKAAEAHVHRLREEFDLEPDGAFLAEIELVRRGEPPTPSRGLLPRTRAVPAELPRTTDVSPDPSQPPATPRTPKPARRPAPWAAGIAAVVLLAGAFGVGRWMKGHAARHVYPRTTIAVLPCRNLSADSSHAFFAGGLHDELLTRLSSVTALTVVGRQSLIGYEPARKPSRQIAEELGVGSIAECSVQVVGDRLRVNVRLLEPVTETTLWANSYDSTLDDAFAVQRDIAQRIVAAVGATLTSAEAEAIAAAPTRNAQAYQFYLQGLEYYRRPGFYSANVQTAGRLFERALALDSTFAPAHAALSSVHWIMYRLGNDRTPGRLEQARREAETALRLDPDLPQAHLALGMARYVSGRAYREALDEFNRGLRGAPNDAELWGRLARVERDLGNWDSMTIAYRQARRLDPRNANLLQSIGDAFHYLHRYRDAIAAYRGEMALAPDVVQARLSMGWSYVLWTGQLDTLRNVLRDLPRDAEPGLGGPGVGVDRLALLFIERRADSILSLLRVMTWATGGSPDATLARALWDAKAYGLKGDSAAARAANDTAEVILRSRERAQPDDEGVHAMLGVILATLGRRTDALREARWLALSDGYRADADVAAARAAILVRVGMTDAALVDLERAVAGPSTFSAPLLRLLPNWDVFRVDPRFQAMLSKYANP